MPANNYDADLWRMQMQRDIPGLIRALQHEQAETRRRSAAALRALGAVEALPPLRAALDEEPDPMTRAAIAAALDALQATQTDTTEVAAVEPTADLPASAEARPVEAPAESEFDRFIRLLASDRPETVISAAAALGNLGDQRAAEALILRFNRPDTPVKVQLAIAEVLLMLDSAPAEIALLGALRSPEWRIRRNGAAILGKMKAAWAVEPLAKLLRDPNGAVRLTAHAALRHINTVAAREILARLPRAQLPKTKPLPPPNADPMPRQTSPELTRLQEETKPRRPKNPDGSPVVFRKDETHKLAWPRRYRRKVDDPHIAQTKELNPHTLEEAQERFRDLKEQQKQRRQSGDQNANEGTSSGDGG